MVHHKAPELQWMLRGEAQARSSTAAALVVESAPLDKHIYPHNTQADQIIAVISAVQVVVCNRIEAV